ncbi:MAG: hypothetical protein ABL999_10075 [Pyrinomonadaceae bacterium]
MQVETDVGDVSRLAEFGKTLGATVREAAFDKQSQNSFDKWEFLIALIWAQTKCERFLACAG